MMAGKAHGTAKKAQITVLESRVESLELRNSHSIKQQPITAWRQSMGKMKRSGLFFLVETPAEKYRTASWKN
jgi:hypothetical protein